MTNDSSELPSLQSSSDSFSRIEGDNGDHVETEILSVTWNQDYKCFTAGTSSGFRIYNCEPLKETILRDLKSGGFAIVEMLFRTNIFALVGGSTNKQYPPNKVMIWDDHASRCSTEFAFRSHVKAVKLGHDIIVVVLEHQICIYSFAGLELIRSIDTYSNPKGICSISHNPNTSVLACPGMQKGEVRVDYFGLKVTKFVTAHDSDISCLTLTPDGLLLATASVKGTLIRIFNTMDGTLLQEVRRGAERAEIYSIAISPCIQWLVVSSDKGTIHLFRLRVQVFGDYSPTENDLCQGPAMVEGSSTSGNAQLSPPNMGANSRSSLSFMKGVLPKYFRSQWSFARCHLPEVTRYIAAFGAHNTVMVLGMDGSFTKCSFDPVKGGEMVKQEHVRFLETRRNSSEPSA